MESEEEIRNILREILKWTKFEGMQRLKGILDTTLDDDTKKLIYHFSDGSDRKQIAAQVSDQTISNYWKKWAMVGIMEPCPKFKGRYWKLFALEEVGIEIPETRIKPSSPQKEAEEETQAGASNGSRTI